MIGLMTDAVRPLKNRRGDILKVLMRINLTSNDIRKTSVMSMSSSYCGSEF